MSYCLCPLDEGLGGLLSPLLSAFLARSDDEVYEKGEGTFSILRQLLKPVSVSLGALLDINSRKKNSVLGYLCKAV